MTTTHDPATQQTTTTGGANWGRWGADDERGALNLLSPDVVLQAVRTCRTGKIYNLGLPVQRQGVPVFDYRGAPQRLTLTNQTDEGAYAEFGAPDRLGTNEDVLVIAGHNGTHMDALCHVYSEDAFYNGHSKNTFSTQNGAGRCGIDKMGGFATRAVVLDLPAFFGVETLEPGYTITGDNLADCLAKQGQSLRTGDALLVRTGWLEIFDKHQSEGQPPPFAQPGLGLSCVDFIRDNGVAVVGADNAAIEVIPFDENRFLSVHVELLVKLGIPLLEHLVLTRLTSDGCRQALLVVAPMMVTGGTGSPINPIAIG